MDRLSIAVVQLGITLGQPEENFQRASALLSKKDPGVQLAMLPELWSTGYDLENAGNHSFSLAEGTNTPLAQLARDANVYLCGSTLESRNGKHYNAQTIYSSQGELIGTYRKIHLFGLLDEPQFLSAGEEPVVLEMPWGKTGLAICYDLRFPELFRYYAMAGVRLLLICAEWPHPRLEHWRTLIKARAIENQCFVVACNAVGTAKGNVFFGHSLVVDPWGEVLVEGGEEETILQTEIDLSKVDEIRDRYTFLNDRRTGIYSLP